MSQHITPVIQSISPQAFEMLKPNVRINLQALVERLDRYIAKMSPSVLIDPRDGAQQQQILWQTIRDVLRRPPEEFNPMYTELLFKIHQHRNGCFSKRYVNRFFEYVNLRSADMRTFTRMINLMVATANPSSRHLVAKQTDLRRILRDFGNEQAIEKLAAYYAI